MTKEMFNEIFDNEILPFIDEIQQNNLKIVKKNMEKCKKEIYEEYKILNGDFKETIFGNTDAGTLLDRHKVAACICCAFLKVSVFYKDELIAQIKETKQPVEMYFYYVNEMVAFYAGCRFLSFFMSSEHMQARKMAEEVIRAFPILPPVKKNSKECYDSILFNLSQIKTKKIGLDHFDVYSYSMFYFMLESYFYTQVLKDTA